VDQIEVTVTARGLVEPNLAAQHVVNLLKRSMYLVNGKPGEFEVTISATAPGMTRPQRTVLAGGEWRRE
jgi:hypothetical protein